MSQDHPFFTNNLAASRVTVAKAPVNSLTRVVSVAPNYFYPAQAPAPCTKRKERGTQTNSHRLRFGPAALLLNMRYLQKKRPFFCQKH